MTLLKIARMGHPVLRQIAAPIDDPTAPEIDRLAAQMIETMHDAQGVGLAAPQVHVSQRLIVFFAPPGRSSSDDEAEIAPLTVLINPVIEPLSDEKADGWEGCLSIPGLTGRVPRYTHIGYRGVGTDGKPVEREAKGFHARVIQHELDHLDGILYPDRMASMDTLMFDTERVHHREDENGPEDEGDQKGEGDSA